MRTTLKLECIGDNHVQEWRNACRFMGGILNGGSMRGGPPRPWVAKITMDGDQIKRTFLRGQKDYSEANSVGSRGVYLYFHLEMGLYDVFSLETWKRSRRYFLKVEESGETKELEKEEAITWARKNCWEPMY